MLLEWSMYADMDEWTEIRKRVLLGGESTRAILRETGNADMPLPRE